MTKDFLSLPKNLPIPADDGKAKHLVGKEIPDLNLDSSVGLISLREIFQRPSVLFLYPKAGSPFEHATDTTWDQIPGARGCTPQSCGFRDHYAEFQALGIQIYGLSVQSPEVHQEFVQRYKLPFSILSDQDYRLTEALALPTFEFQGRHLIKRMAWYIESGRIQKVFYPIFPPDKNAEVVLTWLGSRKQNLSSIKIRDAKSEDVSLIFSFIQKKAEFDRQAGAFSGDLRVNPEKLRKTLFGVRPFSHVLFAESTGIPIGFALYAFHYSSFAGQPSLWLDDLYVNEDNRGRGAGAALMHRLFQVARENDCTHLAWTADARNRRGLEFYSRLGAKIVEQKDYRCFLRWDCLG